MHPLSLAHSVHFALHVGIFLAGVWSVVLVNTELIDTAVVDVDDETNVVSAPDFAVGSLRLTRRLNVNNILSRHRRIWVRFSSHLGSCISVGLELKISFDGIYGAAHVGAWICIREHEYERRWVDIDVSAASTSTSTAAYWR